MERDGHRSLEEIERMLDGLVKSEGEPDLVQFSGGEPTLHPQFFEILNAAKRRPIRHMMINAGGFVLVLVIALAIDAIPVAIGILIFPAGLRIYRK